MSLLSNISTISEVYVMPASKMMGTSDANKSEKIPDTISSFIDHSSDTRTRKKPTFNRNQQHDGSDNTSSSHPETDTRQVARSLWIGNIDPSISETELRTLFSAHGRIESLRMLPDRECAFVNFERLEDAIQAKEHMQGTPLGNMIIRIGYGRHSSESHTPPLTAVTPTPVSTNTHDVVPTRSLYVGNIDPATSPELLTQHFAQFGPIESCRLLPQKSCAFLNFKHTEDAVKARREMHSQLFQGRTIRVNFGREQRNNDAASSSTDTKPPRLSIVTSVNTANATPTTTHTTPYSTPYSSSSTTTTNTTMTTLPSSMMSSMTATDPEDAAFSSTSSSSPVSATASDLLLPSAAAALLPPLPPPTHAFSLAQLKEMRRRLENQATARDMDKTLRDYRPFFIDLSVDPYGNTIAQRLVEKCNEDQRLLMVKEYHASIPSLSVHRHGTWVIQKLVETSQGVATQQHLIMVLKEHIPLLLQDPHGNYVAQCCLKLGPRNAFIFEAMASRLTEVACNKFGARAMKSILSSPLSSVRQQKAVAVAVVHHGVLLAQDPHGILVLQWLLDESHLPGRYNAFLNVVASALRSLALHRSASLLLQKLVLQTEEPSVVPRIAELLFERDTLQALLRDPHASLLLLKVFSALSEEDDSHHKALYAQRIHTLLQSSASSSLMVVDSHASGASSAPMPLSKLLEEVQAVVDRHKESPLESNNSSTDAAEMVVVVEKTPSETVPTVESGEEKASQRRSYSTAVPSSVSQLWADSPPVFYPSATSSSSSSSASSSSTAPTALSSSSASTFANFGYAAIPPGLYVNDDDTLRSLLAPNPLLNQPLPSTMRTAPLQFRECPVCRTRFTALSVDDYSSHVDDCKRKASLVDLDSFN